MRNIMTNLRTLRAFKISVSLLILANAFILRGFGADRPNIVFILADDLG